MDYKHPGIYNQEVASAPAPITGVSASAMGLIGFSKRGVVNKPMRITSFSEYTKMFGSFTEKGLSAHMAYAYFANGGSQIYFVRVVADDALTADWNYKASVLSELVSNTAEATGVYNLSIDKVPVIADGFKLTFTNASTPANQYVFVADENGVLTVDSSSGANAITAGGSGSIDFVSGEIHVEINNPSYFSGSTDWVIADYQYVSLGFAMKWAGEDGNKFRVRITQGSDYYLVQDEARWTRMTVIVEENISASDLENWVVRETFNDVVFDDPTDVNYVTTVINADGASSYIAVIDYGNTQNPKELQGIQIQNEDIYLTQRPQGSVVVPPVAYDGTTKGWVYTLNSVSFPKTLKLGFQFADSKVLFTGASTAIGAVLTDSNANFGSTDGLKDKVVVNVTQGKSAIITANDATTITGVLSGSTNWAIGDEYAVIEAGVNIGVGTGSGTESISSQGDANNPVELVKGSVTVAATLTTAGSVILFDDGNGNLQGGSTPTTVATIDYVTGQITSAGGTLNEIDFDSAWTGDTVSVGSVIKYGSIYAKAVKLKDDANGNVTFDNDQDTGAPVKFVLNTVAKNKISYDSGTISLMWGIKGNPSASITGIYKEFASYYEEPDTNVIGNMAGGEDGSAISSTDLIDPALIAQEAGIYAFGKVNALMTLVSADFQSDVNVANAMLAYAELMKDKFVILSVPHGLSYQEAVSWRRFVLGTYSNYGAVYYPHVKILDPVTNVNLDMPAGGHIAGSYATTDSFANVGTAPAGIKNGTLKWSVGLELDLTEKQVGVVYENNINALVQWEQTGRVIWGARTLDVAGGEHPYIQGRRVFMFVEKSVFNATHGYVFDNNNSGLWAKISGQVTTFLTGLTKSGYFASTNPEEAFFVICDETNNPQSSVDQGFVFTDIGLATNKPAEFLVFRYQQKSISKG